ncbi:hypothetical protein [Methylocapsa sp. S129]|uniref:hypothetical protein n=1 Tax=Methylocapsa sp. S129 TaxID=1641869 RepID=UPI00131E5205|nr:hypothetical protein [Methylocapsa sp. S129]
MTNEISEYEAYINARSRLLDLLKTLCDKDIIYFNIAWEIKDDAYRDASIMLNLEKLKLSPEQRAGIVKLIEMLKLIPSTAVNVANEPEIQVGAMRHPSWSSLRTYAPDLIRLLSAENKHTL